MNTKTTGHKAEQLVADYLGAHGHKIITLNWRTRWCEIDIVSINNKVVYFTEVKYRNSKKWGDGVDYVRQNKLRQMHFAAEMWLHDSNWKGEAQLQVASIDSTNNIELFEV